MQAIASSVSRFFDTASAMSQGGYAGVTQTSVVSASSQKSLDIALVTAEGDKVTISGASSLQVGFGSYDYRGRLNGNEVNLRGKTLQVASENSFSLSVEGNLSKEELTDIKKLVAKIEDFGAAFFSHPLNDAPLKTLALGNDLGAIASFEANLSVAQQVTVAREVQQEGEVVSAPVAPGSTSASPPVNTSSLATRDAKGLLETLLEAARDKHVDKEKFAEKLPMALAQLVKQLASTFSVDEAPKNTKAASAETSPFALAA
ncbi:MAG: hypothetical protein HY267_01370 [Deltaproteobacteria bacterium]|nr:hypothetical protein [Deltaproteobacteria bacterium]